MDMEDVATGGCEEAEGAGCPNGTEIPRTVHSAMAGEGAGCPNGTEVPRTVHSAMAGEGAGGPNGTEVPRTVHSAMAGEGAGGHQSTEETETAQSVVSYVAGKGAGHHPSPKGADTVRSVVDYNKRLVHTAVFCFGFLVLGWVVGQRGAIFLDLLFITATDMAEGSVLFTLAGLASIGGTLVGGFALDWSGRPLMMMAAVFAVNAALNSTLALCEPLALMAAVYFLSHFTLSVYDVVVSPHLASLWPGVHSGQFLQALHFSFSVGAVLSPLATQPFLAPRPVETHLNPVNHTEQHLQDHLNPVNLTDRHLQDHRNPVNHTEQHLQDHRYQSATRAYEDNSYNGSSFIADGNGGFMTFFENSTSSHSSNTVTAGLPGEREKSTRVLYALLISGCLCLMVALLMVILMVLPVQKLKAEERLKAERRIPAKGKVYLAALLMVGVYNFLGSSVEDVFPLYLMTFVVRHLHWSKRWGAEVTSVYWVGLALGRLGGVGLVKVLSPARIIVLCLSAMMTSLLVMLVASIVRAHWAVWLGAGAVGLSTSVLFPTGLTYVHQQVSPLTGRVSALVFTTPMVGAMVNPVLLAALMTRLHDLAYLLLFLLQTALALVSFFMLHALARHLNRHRQGAVTAAAAAADDDDDVVTVREKLMQKEEGGGTDAVHS